MGLNPSKPKAKARIRCRVKDRVNGSKAKAKAKAGIRCRVKDKANASKHKAKARIRCRVKARVRCRCRVRDKVNASQAKAEARVRCKYTIRSLSCFETSAPALSSSRKTLKWPDFAVIFLIYRTTQSQ